MQDLLRDPVTLRMAIMSTVLLLVGAVLIVGLHVLSEYLEHRVPRYRRELEATYVSFHRFLLAVRCAAVRRLE
jgi:hypothetical protein